jgi:hypothetical protein
VQFIEHDQVILVTRDTRNRGSPKVTMYEVKGLNDSSRGARKGQPNVLPRGQVIAKLRDDLERASGSGWLRRRCQVAEEAAIARAYGITRGVGVVGVGRGRADRCYRIW